MRIGILTGGGDCPGLNAAIRAVVKRGTAEHGSSIVGFRNGWEGVIRGDAVPLSRKPGFSKNVLAAGLHETGIDYVHLKALGTPPAGREAARKGRFAEMERIYAEQLETPEATLQAAQLADLAAEKPSALLCFERDPAHCHRSRITERLQERVKLKVEDLFPAPL